MPEELTQPLDLIASIIARERHSEPVTIAHRIVSALDWAGYEIRLAVEAKHVVQACGGRYSAEG